MSHTSQIKRAILASTSILALLIATPAVLPVVTPAVAQTNVVISVEFRTALSPYGAWQSVPRLGEVWVPAQVSRDWQPYTVGHWVYSDDYGWYWASENEEAEWGWVTFHYGRWAHADAYGWVWVPGNEWGPAWVDWRRGDEYVGWAPLPPEEFIVEYRQRPNFWMFVRTADIISPRIRTAFVPIAQRGALLQRTVVVNRTVVLRERGFAVNPGIAPAIIAAAARQPVRTFDVRPHVVAGTANIPGAVEVRADDLRRGGNRPGQSIAQASVVRQTANAVQPAQNIPPPQALGHTENGTLGDHPPRAAVGTQNRSTPGAPPANQGAGRDQPPTQNTTPPATSGQAPPNTAPPSPRREAPAAQPPQQQPQQQPPRQGAAPPATSGQAPPNAAPPSPRREAPAAQPPQQQPQQQPPRQGAAPPATSGQAPPNAAPPNPRREPPAAQPPQQ